MDSLEVSVPLLYLIKGFIGFLILWLSNIIVKNA